MVTHRKKVRIIWYILQCPDENTAGWIRFCKENIREDVLKDAFVLSYERMKRYQGDWHLEWDNVFSGCIFLETEELDALSEELLQNEILSQHLQEGRGLQRISGKAESLLQEFSGKSHQIPMSRGVIRKGITIVTEGPLRGREQWITRIDRHKRLAFLNLILGTAPMKAGLEITEKTL